MVNLKDLTVEQFINVTASDAPAPGGGSVAALAGGLGVALAEMVANLTIGKAKYAEVEDEMKELAAAAAEIRVELTAAIQKDTEKWAPDFGPAEMHPTAGVTAIGARMPLVAFNVNLGTDNLEIANEIARRIRHINGGYRFIKAIGIMLEDRNIAQVSMNLTNYEKTAVYRAFEAVKMEARRYGVPVLESEIVGLLPMQALVDCAEYYLQIANFDPAQVMENRLLEEN